jgi:hypothetical protein
MTTDAELEIHRALRESQNKHTYFLLAVVGAAIALVINQTQSASLSWSQLPLAAAVLAWALSFLFGYRNRAYVSSGLHTNAALFNVNAGRHKLAGTNPEAIQVARETLNEIFEDQSSKANRFANLQFRFLVAGAILYVAWHVLEMYLRTI